MNSIQIIWSHDGKTSYYTPGPATCELVANSVLLGDCGVESPLLPKWMAERHAWMERTIRDLMLAGFCLCVLVGCGPVTVPKKDLKPSPAVVEPLTIEAVVQALADACESGAIRDTDRLARVGKVIERQLPGVADKLTVVDGVPAVQRDLTADDIAKLRGVK